MKIKFTDEVSEAILDIAKMDLDATGQEIYGEPERRVLRLLSEHKLMNGPGKYLSRIRREISFLLEYVALRVKGNNVKPTPSAPQEHYRSVINFCRGAISGALLENPAVIVKAIQYGVLRISKLEAEKLIELNRVEPLMAYVLGCKMVSGVNGDGVTCDVKLSELPDSESDFYGIFLRYGSGVFKDLNWSFDSKDEAIACVNKYLEQGFFKGVITDHCSG